ncbi:branched-chain amino acid ABC transporter permease [Candidatus Bathyarchaeota archaeon]|nr:branched-chain amino acid ABC transporter permease [Candidatus Bathyarchaeota archaeon]
MDLPAIVLFGINIVTFTVDLGIFFAIFLIVSLTLNLEAGYTGVPNFGKAMFVAGGAAIAGSVSGRLAALLLGIDAGDYVNRIPIIINSLNSGLAKNPLLSIEILVLGIVLAAFIGAGLGYLASYPAIRLREDYLGMLLLASAQFFQIFLRSYPPLIGGVQGLEIPDVFGWANTGVGTRDVVILGVVGLFALLVYLYVERMARSPLGRALRAVRDNEMASRALGKDDVAIRKKVIVIASAISGMAGALLTFYVESIGPDTWSRQDWTFPFWVIVILGGAANNSGVALGAFIYEFVLKVVDQAKFLFKGLLPFDVSRLEFLAFSAILILVLAFKPAGLIPEKPSLTLDHNTVFALMQAKREETTAQASDTPRNGEPDG